MNLLSKSPKCDNRSPAFCGGARRFSFFSDMRSEEALNSRDFVFAGTSNVITSLAIAGLMLWWGKPAQ